MVCSSVWVFSCGVIFYNRVCGVVGLGMLLSDLVCCNVTGCVMCVVVCVV